VVGRVDPADATQAVYEVPKICSRCTRLVCSLCRRSDGHSPCCHATTSGRSLDLPALLDSVCSCGIDQGGFEFCVLHFGMKGVPNQSPQQVLVDYVSGAKFGVGPWLAAIGGEVQDIVHALAGWEPRPADVSAWAAILASPPRLHRGYGRRGGWRSLSWTTDFDIASTFPRVSRYPCDARGPYVATYWPKGDELLAICGTASRDEKEVLMDPKRIRRGRVWIEPGA
jgi:hypothetical protein